MLVPVVDCERFGPEAVLAYVELIQVDLEYEHLKAELQLASTSEEGLGQQVSVVLGMLPPNAPLEMVNDH